MKAISYPFTLDTFGKVISTEDSNKIYTHRVMTLLSTLVFGRPMRSDYGVDMSRAMYESGNDFKRAVSSSVTRAISTFLPMLVIENIKVTLPNSSGEATIDIRLRYPDGTAGSLLVSANEFNDDGTIVGDIY